MAIMKTVRGECVSWMKDNIKDESIDICITSPPYKDVDGWTPELMRDCFIQVFRVLKNNSLFFLNFGHLAEDKFRAFETCSIAIDWGFQLNESITWVKNHYKPIQGKKRLNNLTEFIFLLYKGKMPVLDRLSIGVPYKDKSNAKRFSGGRDLKCAGNVWYIPYETIQKSSQKLHNDRYPVELPLRCLKLSGLKSGTVLDPFSGSFTTSLAARQLELDSIGIEKNDDNYKIGTERLCITP